MDSLYSQYIQERTDDFIIENDYGFATYRFLSNTQVYIIDIFVLPKFRQQNRAAELADQICIEAKLQNKTELIGTVNPSCKSATESIKVLIAYGMKVDSSKDNLIIFKKGI